jgi:hypothetical protein
MDRAADSRQWGYRPGVEVWVTPPDREHKTWRIDVKDGGPRRGAPRGTVFRRQPLRRPATMDALGPWLLERGIDPDDLRTP